MTEPPASAEREELLRGLDTAYDGLRLRLAQALADDRAGRAPAANVTLAQAIAHVARWSRWASQHVAGERREDDVVEDVRNARWLADDTYAEVDAAIADLESAHLELRERLTTLTGADWEARGRAWAEDASRHLREHTDAPLSFPVSRPACLDVFVERFRSLRDRLAADLEAGVPPDARGIDTRLVALHVARWDRASVQVLARRREDPGFEDPYAADEATWNARWLAEDASVPADESLPRLVAAHDELRTALEQLDEGGWDRSGIAYALGTASHYRSHTDDPLMFPLPE